MSKALILAKLKLLYKAIAVLTALIAATKLGGISNPDLARPTTTTITNYTQFDGQTGSITHQEYTDSNGNVYYKDTDSGLQPYRTTDWAIKQTLTATTTL